MEGAEQQAMRCPGRRKHRGFFVDPPHRRGRLQPGFHRRKRGMPVMLIPAKHYIATVLGSAVRLVVCENCKTEFVYILNRRTESSSTSLLYLDNQGAQERA